MTAWRDTPAVSRLYLVLLLLPVGWFFAMRGDPVSTGFAAPDASPEIADATWVVGLQCPAPAASAADVDAAWLNAVDHDDPWSDVDPDAAPATSSAAAVDAGAHNAVDDDDPWADADLDAAVPVTQPEAIEVQRATWHHVRVLQVARHVLHTLPFAEDAYPLATYDLRGLSLGGQALPASLAPGDASGSFGTAPAPPGARDLWADVARAILVAVGSNYWPQQHTLLAWEPKRALLFVRQAPWALRNIEQVLDRFDEPTGAYPIRLWRQGDPKPLLEMDVPWRRPVRSMHGQSWAYVQDYEVEIGYSSQITNAILSEIEEGVGLSAIWRDTQGVERASEVMVEVCVRPEAPRFEPFKTRLCSQGPVFTLEIPQIGQERLRARLPAVAGTRRAVVLRNFVGTLEVGTSRSAAWRRWRRLPEAAEPSRPVRPANLRLRLTGTRSGTIGEARIELPATGEQAQAVLRQISADWLAEGVEQVGLLFDDTYADILHAGRVLVDARCLDPWAPGCARVDLSVSLEAWSGQARAIPLRSHASAPKAERLVKLPACHAFVTHHHALLEANQEQSVDFIADVGLGREFFTLRVRREVPLPE